MDHRISLSVVGIPGIFLPSDIAGPLMRGLYVAPAGGDDGAGGSDKKIDLGIERDARSVVRGSGLWTEKSTLSLQDLSNEVLRLFQQFPQTYEAERGLSRRLQNLAAIAPQEYVMSTLTPSQKEWFELSARSPDRNLPIEINLTVAYRIVDFYNILKVVYERKNARIIAPSPEESFGWIRDESVRRLLIDILWARIIEFRKSNVETERGNIVQFIKDAQKDITMISAKELVELVLLGDIPLRMER